MRYEDARVFMMESNFQLNKFWRKRIREFQEAMATIYDIDLMREALEKVEWEDDSERMYVYCPWCGESYYVGSPGDPPESQWKHAPDCLRQRALGLDKKDG